MKKFVFGLCFLLINISGVNADWFIINQDNEITAKCKYVPNFKDLENRNEIAEYSELDLDIKEAEYRGNKIVKHVKTQSEIQSELDEQGKIEEIKILNNEIKKMALANLVGGGMQFKYITVNDFDAKDAK